MAVYSKVTVSGYNASPPSDDGTVSAANQLNWSKHIDKIGNPIKTAFDASETATEAAFAAVTPLLKTTTSKTANFTVQTSPTEAGTIYLVDATAGAITATLPAAATAAAGFAVTIKKVDSSTNIVTIDGDGAETIDGATTLTVTAQYAAVTVVSDGSEWHVGMERPAARSAVLARPSADLTNVTGDGTLYTIVFATEIYDRNGDFDGTSTFTAPVTGIYQVGVTISIGGLTASHTRATGTIVTSNRSYSIADNAGGALRSSANTLQFSGSIDADMDAGDTLTVTLLISGGTLVADVTTDTALSVRYVQ